MYKSFIEKFERFDWMLLLAATILTIIGLLGIYGIAAAREATDFFQFQKQLIVASAGIIAVFACVFFDYRHLRSFSMVAYGIGVLLLLGVLVFGTTVRGTRGWFVIGGLSFQPVEIAKVALAIFLSSYLSRYVHKRIGWVPLCGSFLATLTYVGLIMLQPDFGSALVLLIMWFALVVFVGLPRRAWLAIGGVVVIGAGLLWSIGLKPYQQDRLIAFLKPAADPRGAGYNVMQARIAIGSGGFLGKGLGEGSQARLRFLPEAPTDFIFSVIGEELGLLGISIVLGLFAVLLLRLVWIAFTTHDPFAQILLIAFVSIIGFHLLVNAGMNVGLMPVTGIPLPFVSAAASSLLSMFVMIAISESIAVYRQPSDPRE